MKCENVKCGFGLVYWEKRVIFAQRKNESHMKQELRDRIRKTILNVDPKAKIILYGSQARGDARPDSDIDLLILLLDSYEPTVFVKRKSDISGALYDLSLEIDKEISPLILVPKVFYARKTPFTVNVINQGIEL
ncbi:MAG: nucleotidyltransferase domain-containing protein [Bacteroides sp.]|nr:nucleotidyltransferase domain-containing protein [Bacteroides sp.]MCM1380164.1 nucleotidyltransferase domain-containing protein [Bacteroides sp.]MCM1446472.1 nucleotidyltransferase domain-containing protein [Prevotella sp.]